MPPATRSARGAGPGAAAATGEQAERWIFGLFLAVLVWAPLPLGSNRGWAQALLALALLALWLAWLVHRVQVGRPLWPRLQPGALPLLLLTLYALAVGAQLLPLPAAWLAGLAPPPPSVPAAGVVLPAWAQISVDPASTRQYLVACITYWCAFALAVVLVVDRPRLERLALVLVASGVLQALVGIFLYSMRAEYRFLYFDISHYPRLMGTFSYTNFMAGYMELCLSVGLGLMLARMGRSSNLPNDWKGRVSSVLRFLLSPKMRLRLLLVLMVIALVLTRSRMGNAGFFTALLVVGGFSLFIFRELRKPALWLGLSIVVVDVLVISQWVGLDRVMARIEGTTMTVDDAAEQQDGSGQAVGEESFEQRSVAGADALAMIRHRPWLGYGGGTFYTAFPPFGSEESSLGYYDHAHNDYAEIAADTGLFGLGRTAVIAMRRRRRRLQRGLAFGVLMALACFGLHSAVDFNLQNPANALTFTVILSMAWVQQRRTRGDDEAEEEDA